MAEYNGWSNYETWLANLWMSNSEGDQEYWNEQAQECLDEAEGDKEKAADELASRMENYWDEMLEEQTKDMFGLFVDLLNAGMQAIDWLEIAENWLSDFTYDGGEDDDDLEE